MNRPRLLALLGLLATLAQARPAAPEPLGSIAGRVTFAGPAPPAAFLEVTKDVVVCGPRVPDDRLVVGPGGALANAVIFLETWPGPPPSPPPHPLPVDNRGCRFVPRVLAAQVGATLAIRNSDPVLHNLRAVQGDQPVLNVVLTTQGQVTERRLRRPGIQRLQCDVHAHMEGYLLVFDHPGFAVTDATGAFRISRVPPGRHTVKAWHEGWQPRRGGQAPAPPLLQAREVAVSPGEEATVSFTFDENSLDSRHPRR